MDATQKADLLRRVRKGPQNELTDIRVQEIGLVDRAANARRFVVRKSQDMKIKLSPAQKQATQLAAADLCDKANTLLAIISGADEDEAAGEEGSDTVGALAKAMSDMANGMAEQYGKKKPAEDAEKAGKPFPGAAPPFGADGKPAKEGEEKKPKDAETKKDADVEKAELDNFTAASVTISAARDQLWSASDLMGKDPAGAAEKLKQIVGMLDNAKQFMAASGVAVSAEKSAEIAKAGRVLSAKNAKLLKACQDALKALADAAGIDGEDTADSTVTKSATPLADEVIAKAVNAAIAPLQAKIAEIEKADAAARGASPSAPKAAKDPLPASNAGGKQESVRKSGEKPLYNPNDIAGSLFGKE